MRAVVQRVDRASVTVDGQVTGACQKGLMVLFGVEAEDTPKDLQYIVDKVCGLRIFEDEAGKMNLSVKDVGGEILAVSQFTLYGDCRKGKRPSFDMSGNPENAKVELHRPYIDEIICKCPECGKSMKRVPEVIDCWFDSGAMPFAQHHYPFENKEKFEQQFPAQFISEAVDQTRGWFYSLMAESTLLFNKSPYENVIVLGLVIWTVAFLAKDPNKVIRKSSN